MKRIGISFFLGISCTILYSVPAAVFIIRHAEKELKLNSQQIPMKTKTGKPEYTKFLSLRGWQRAYAISFDMNFFNNSEYGIPAAIFASAPPKPTGSVRPIETVTPLASRLKMKVNHDFKPNEQLKLVEAIMKNPKYHGKLIVISFEHHHIPGLAAAFKATTAPNSWPNDVFDRIWEITFDTNTGKVTSFQNRPQKLLFGDNQN